MFLAFAESPIPANVGTIFSTSQDNTALPDCFLGPHYADLVRNLDSLIGNTLVYNGFQIFKAYADWNAVLHEYTVVKVRMTGWARNEDRYIPIAIKRYQNDHATMLSVSALNKLQPFFELATHNEIIALSDLFYSIFQPRPETTLCDQMVESPGAEYYTTDFTSILVQERKEFHHRLSPDVPATISGLLNEIGSHYFSCGNCAATTLLSLYGPDVTAIANMYLDVPYLDNVSLMSMSTNPFLPIEWFTRMSDYASCRFYNSMARDHGGLVRESYRRGRFLLMDRTCLLYDLLGIDNLIECLFLEEATDIDATVDENEFGCQGTIIFYNTPVVMYTLPQYLQSVQRTIKRESTGVAKIGIRKNWLDELYLIIMMKNGTVFNFHINLAMYHLVSPSLVRKDVIRNLVPQPV